VHIVQSICMHCAMMHIANTTIAAATAIPAPAKDTIILSSPYS